MQASTRMDPPAAVTGEDLQDQVAALRGAFWQGQPLVPLGARTPEAQTQAAPTAGVDEGRGARLCTAGLMCRALVHPAPAASVDEGSGACLHTAGPL